MDKHALYKLFVIVIVIMALPLKSSGLDTIRANIAQMPVVAENHAKGVYIDLLNAITRETGVHFNIKVQPFARSMNDIIARTADFHMPLIEIPAKSMGELPFDYSQANFYKVNFVLYTHKNSTLRLDQLKNAKIETDRAHRDYFPFETIPSSCIECSLKKVRAKRIDGFIFADVVTDGFVRENHMADIKRQLYGRFEVRIVLQKGKRGSELDTFLTQAIESLKQSGEFQKIVAPLNISYDDWQP